MTQEFVISVIPIGEDEYFIRTERGVSGVPLAEERVKWPVESWLLKSRQLMTDPLLTVFQSSDSHKNANFHPESESLSSQEPIPNLVTLGKELYNCLFQGSLRESWTVAQGIAQHQREPLKLRLGLRDKRLLQLPWEVLHAGDRPLASNTDIIFSRYQPGMILSHPLKRSSSDGKIKVLIALVNPNNQEQFKVKREVEYLQQELQRELIPDLPTPLLKSIYHPLEIQLTILEQPDREQLTQALEQGRFDIFHYSGHSRSGNWGGELHLVSQKTGLTQILNGNDLAGLLVNNGVQMVILNSCQSAYQDPLENGNTEHNLAQVLVNRGIPGVLAMAGHIPDAVALHLTRIFYRNLHQGYPIDLSLGRARAALMTAYDSHQLYWALPILYLHESWNGELIPISANSSLQDRENIPPLSVKNLPQSFVYPSVNLPLSPPPLPESSSEINLISSPRNRPLGFNFFTLKKSAQILLIIALLLGIGGGISLWVLRKPTPRDLLPNSEVFDPNFLPNSRFKKSENLRKLSTTKVTSIAVDNFHQGNLNKGIIATEVLLDRQALEEVIVILEQVPTKLQNFPEINFLKGRLAWQFVQKGNPNFNINDAQRFWQEAIKDSPRSSKYYNALGFILYEKGSFLEANRIFLQGLELAKSTPNPSPEFLTSLAGLALVHMKMAEESSFSEQQKLLNQAIIFRQKVHQSDPLNFQVSSLSKNWLWSEKAIRDWRSLQRLSL